MTHMACDIGRRCCLRRHRMAGDIRGYRGRAKGSRRAQLVLGTGGGERGMGKWEGPKPRPAGEDKQTPRSRSGRDRLSARALIVLLVPKFTR